VEEFTLGGFLHHNPWVVTIVFVFMVPITAIVFGTLTAYWRRSRQAELDAALKQQMLELGMSADEIVRVLEAKSQSSKVSCRERRSAGKEI